MNGPCAGIVPSHNNKRRGTVVVIIVSDPAEDNWPGEGRHAS